MTWLMASAHAAGLQLYARFLHYFGYYALLFHAREVVRGARSATRWAPIARIYLVCSQEWNGITYLDSNLHMQSTVANPILYHGFEAPHDVNYHRTAGADDNEHFRPWFGDQEEDRPDMEDWPIGTWQATIILYHFQAISERSVIWVEMMSHMPWEKTSTLRRRTGLSTRSTLSLVMTACIMSQPLCGYEGLYPLILDATACGGRRFVIYAGVDICYDRGHSSLQIGPGKPTSGI